MTTTSDITLIGGGAIGLLTAREFIAAGATVTLIEKNLVGQESSWAGGGILLPLYPWRQADAITQLVIQSLKRYPQLASQLIDDCGIDPEWRSCGLLITKNPDYQAASAWCQTHDIPFEYASKDLYNHLNTVVDNPLWMPTIGQIRNPRLLKSLKQDLLNKGAILHEHCHVTATTLTQKRISHIDTTQGKMAINQLVFTTGAWSQQVFEQLFPQYSRITPAIAPVRGQMLLYQADPETLSHIILDGDHYLIPRRDGKIVVGSTVENQGFDKSITDEAKIHLHDFALNLMPSLKQYPLIKQWAGLRPGTRDGVPYIGQHPYIENVSLNAGHFRNGLVMGPASAQLMVDLILNRPPCVNPAPYSLHNLV